MKPVLSISATLKIPLDAVTQTFAILGIRGSGKTNSAVDMAEELLKHGQQIAVIDPTNAWYGLRSSKDGKSEGFKVIVMGGENGDLPLDGGSGILLADFVVESGASVIFSLRHLSMNDQRRFAQDFAERIYFLKGKSKNRTPIHLFVDEADEFIPQRIPHGFERMFGAFDRLVRRGRSSGIGMTMISQRPQVLNKDTLSQIETLICHRLLHKLDRKNVREAWVDGHDTMGLAQEFMDGLAALKKGDAWIWSPEWLNIFERVHMRERETFDSSFTPKPGQKPRTAKKLAAVDLEELKKKLSATIEKAKADDPKELKAEIARLRDDLAKKAPAPFAPQKIERVDRDALLEAQRAELERIFKGIRPRLEKGIAGALNSVVSQLATALQRQTAEYIEVNKRFDDPTFWAMFSGVEEDFQLSGAAKKDIKAAIRKVTAVPVPVTSSASITIPAPGQCVSIKLRDEGGEMSGSIEQRTISDLKGGPARMMASLAQFHPKPLRWAQLKSFVAIKSKGTFGTYISTLKKRGLIEVAGDQVMLTLAGIQCSTNGTQKAPRTTEEVLTRWRPKFNPGQNKILGLILERRGFIAKSELLQLSGMKSEGSFGTYLSVLKTAGLIIYGPEGVAANKEALFL